MNYTLKIKAKSLAAESRIIRREETHARDRARMALGSWGIVTEPARLKMVKRLKAAGYTEHRIAKTLQRLRKSQGNMARHDLEEAAGMAMHLHRVNVVRPEARATHIARGYIKGTPYRALERPRRGNDPDLARVLNLLIRHHFVGASREELGQAVADWVDGKRPPHLEVPAAAE